MKKRILSTLLALCVALALTLAPVSALYGEKIYSGVCGDNVTWSYSDGTLTMQGTGPMDDYGYSDDGNTYTEPFWYEYRNLPQTVIISDGVTSIGAYVYKDLYDLTSVTIPASVTTIGWRAFAGCDSLTVYYGGSEDQWAQININNEEDGNAPLLNADIRYNSPMPDAPTTPAQPEQPTTPTTPADTKAVLSPQGLKVDGKDIECEKYNIGGSNYFKLRDLAQLLSGTGSQFEVGYDEATATVSITTGKAYTPNGTELLAGVDNSASAQPSNQAILINGEKNEKLTVYNIGGSNFFQLRELGEIMGFEVDYDQDTNTAIVNSVQK